LYHGHPAVACCTFRRNLSASGLLWSTLVICHTPPTHTHEMNTLTQSINQSINFQTGLSSNAAARRPRHQGGAHGGRAPAKIARAPAKITGLIMFNLGCQIKILVFWGIFGVKKSKKNQMANPVFHGG